MNTNIANRLRHTVLALAALALAGLATAAQADPNLVSNGTFSGFNPAANTTAACGFGGGSALTTAQISNCDLPGWQTTGNPPNDNYSFVLSAPYTQGTNFTTTNGGTLSLWGQGEGANSKIPASPAGSNFLAGDGAYQQAYTYTSVATAMNTLYTITFWMSAGQQDGYTCIAGGGTCTDSWQVGLGTTPGTGASVTPTPITLTTGQGWVGAGGGSTNWVQEQVTLMANAANDVLWFFAVGTPGSAQPPFSLLDGVVMTQTTTVPEPPAYGMLMVALLGLLGVRRVYRNKKAKAA
jgi:hypothetical protein